MKCKVMASSGSAMVPKVSEVWKHAGYDDDIYMRIDDVRGADAFGGDSTGKYFFSVHLPSGGLRTTPRKSINIVILKPAGVVDGVVIFEPAI